MGQAEWVKGRGAARCYACLCSGCAAVAAHRAVVLACSPLRGRRRTVLGHSARLRASISLMDMDSENSSSSILFSAPTVTSMERQ